MSDFTTNNPRLNAPLRAEGYHRLNTWQSVQAEVLSRIRSGLWPAGQLIPTEQKLAQELHCARATVNRALSQLAQDGILERRRRVGTRVANGNGRTASETAMLRDEIESTGATYGYRLVRSAYRPAPKTVLDQLHLPAELEMLRFDAIYTANGQPYCLKTGYVDHHAAAGIEIETLEQADLHEWMRENKPKAQGRLAIRADNLSADEARNLSAKEGDPVIVVERSYWEDGNAISFSRRIYRPGHKMSFAL